MDIKQAFGNLLKSAELYQSQGLYEEARGAYQAAYDLIKMKSRAKNKETVLAGLAKKIGELVATAKHLNAAPATHELPDNVQNLIKNLFSFSEKKDPDTQALAEAVTLAKFGQLERAVEELSRLLDKPAVGLVAAKNMLRCHLLKADYRGALDLYEQWRTEKIYTPEALAGIHRLLENHLIKKGIKKPLLELAGEAVEALPTAKHMAEKSEEMLDIGSVVINFDQGPLKGKNPVEFDVDFQTGNTVSLLIEGRDKKILDTLSIGFRLREVQYRSSVAIFRGDGVVSAKLKVHEGPKRGDYHLDVKIQDA